jgi:hypothetical protein
MKSPRIIVTTFCALTIGLVLSLSSSFGDTVEKKVKDTIIAKFDLRDATPSYALKVITAATGIKIFYTPVEADQTKLTLSLTNIPASEALKYVTELANLKFTYEENGVHVTPK